MEFIIQSLFFYDNDCYKVPFIIACLKYFMQNRLIPKIKEFINPANEDSVLIDGQKMENILKTIADEVKILLKEQQAPLSKDLAKKTKQLFVLSSDNESLKQKIEDFQNKLKRSNDKLNEKDKQIIKLMNDKERQKREIQQKFNQTLTKVRNEVSTLEFKIFELQTKHKGQVSDLRKIHKEQIAKAISHEQEIAETNLQQLKRDFAQEKKTLIQTQNKQKSQLIKKYENKLEELRDNHEQEIFQLKKNHNQIQQKESKIKKDLNYKLTNFENEVKRLQGELSKQTLGHERLKTYSQSLSKQLQGFQQKYARQLQQLNDELQKVRNQQSKNQRHLKDEINRLKETLQTTITEKDLLFEQTVNTMKNTHHEELELTKLTLMQQKQIHLTQKDVRHQLQIQKMNQQYEKLQQQYSKLQESYKAVDRQYRAKMDQLINQYEAKLSSIQKRTDYELNLEGKSAKKNHDAIERKYKLQIKALNKQFQEVRQELTRKINDQKLSTTNKLTTHYETIINDIRGNNEVNMKQKMIEFDRKSRAYQKKLAEAEKRRVDLKIQTDRQKLQMQTKIDSLGDLTQRLQSQIEQLHQHIIKLEKEKSVVSHDFEFKLMMKKNQIQQLRDQFEVKELELRTIFNEQIRIKNAEIGRFSEKIAEQVEDMIQKHNSRVDLVEKEYRELKRIVKERTSLPEDVEALKVLHKGYLKLEEELQKERQLKKSVQRELQSKCAIQKVFTSKAFVARVEDSNPNPIKVITMRQFYKAPGTAGTGRPLKSRLQQHTQL